MTVRSSPGSEEQPAERRRRERRRKNLNGIEGCGID
jgi:hypothetical protein